MKKLVFICGVAIFSASGAMASCSIVTGTAGTGSCEEQTPVCTNRVCKVEYKYVALGAKSCRCTGKCSEETPPSGYTISECFCLPD